MRQKPDRPPRVGSPQQVDRPEVAEAIVRDRRRLREDLVQRLSVEQPGEVDLGEQPFGFPLCASGGHACRAGSGCPPRPLPRLFRSRSCPAEAGERQRARPRRGAAAREAGRARPRSSTKRYGRRRTAASRRPLPIAGSDAARARSKTIETAARALALQPSRAHSSAGERSLHTREVPGSIPGAPTHSDRMNRPFSPIHAGHSCQWCRSLAARPAVPQISRLHLSGVPWARIGERTRHRDLSVTANTYTHVLADETELDYALRWRAALADRFHEDQKRSVHDEQEDHDDEPSPKMELRNAGRHASLNGLHHDRIGSLSADLERPVPANTWAAAERMCSHGACISACIARNKPALCRDVCSQVRPLLLLRDVLNTA